MISFYYALYPPILRFLNVLAKLKKKILVVALVRLVEYFTEFRNEILDKNEVFIIYPGVAIYVFKITQLFNTINF